VIRGFGVVGGKKWEKKLGKGRVVRVGPKAPLKYQRGSVP